MPRARRRPAPLSADAIRRAGELIAESRHSLAPIVDFPATLRPQDEAEGYAVQRVHLARFGDRIASRSGRRGYKVGLVSAQMRAACGCTATLGFDAPVYGGVPPERVFGGRAEVPFDRTISPFVEGEFAVEIGADVPPAGAPYTAATIATRVGACMAGIEIVDPRIRYFDYAPPLGPLMVADDGSNWGVVVGEGRRDWRGVDLAAARCTFAKNGATVAAGTGADLAGHPFEVLAWLANALIGRGETLAPGDVVLLGSVTPSYAELDPDCEIVCTWDAFGECRVRFHGAMTEHQKKISLFRK
jgi:2-keto-4-pentenoate hydratase